MSFGLSRGTGKQKEKRKQLEKSNNFGSIIYLVF